MPSVYVTAVSGAASATLTVGPGQGGGSAKGPGCIVIDAIIGQVGGATAAAGTVYDLTVSDSNGTSFYTRIVPTVSTGAASAPINFIFPNGSGPRLYGTAPTIATSAFAGTASNRSDLWVSFHYDY